MKYRCYSISCVRVECLGVGEEEQNGTNQQRASHTCSLVWTVVCDERERGELLGSMNTVLLEHSARIARIVVLLLRLTPPSRRHPLHPPPSFTPPTPLPPSFTIPTPSPRLRGGDKRTSLDLDLPPLLHP